MNHALILAGLNPDLVSRALTLVGEPRIQASLNAALAALIDYHEWIADINARREEIEQ